MRLASRIAMAVVAAALVIGVSLAALVAWLLYRNSQPLDMAVISQLPTVRSADRACPDRNHSRITETTSRPRACTGGVLRFWTWVLDSDCSRHPLCCS